MNQELAQAVVQFQAAMQVALENAKPKPIDIILDGKNVGILDGYKHKLFQELATIIANGMNIFLVGPAGSGKTMLVEQVAQSLSIPFYSISVCAQTTASSLLGYMSATGSYVQSLFRQAYEFGGIFLLDEIDNGNPNVLSVLNSALSNGSCAFPDRMVSKHKDFLLCASGNTYGYGADRQYVGRLEMDAATLDRFVVINFDYDDELEKAISGCPEFAILIQGIRKAIMDLKLRYIVSPRASIIGSKLLALKFDIHRVLEICVWKGMTRNDIEKIKDKVPGFVTLMTTANAALRKKKVAVPA